MNFFIGVNYKSSKCIIPWVESIYHLDEKANVFLVDNFSSNREREICEKLAIEYNFILIPSDNIGYGRALNLAFSYLKNNFNPSIKTVVYAGNIDIKYNRIPNNISYGNYVYLSEAVEGNRNRNPFLTELQAKILPIYNLVLKTNSVLILKGIIGLNKVIGFIPSNVWAIHGSLFTFNGSLLEHGNTIFNENSFLYCEEIEFASYFHEKKFKIVPSDIIYSHDAHVSTAAVVSDLSDFLKLWKKSFFNWNKRFIKK